jgi:hypothetical protein
VSGDSFNESGLIGQARWMNKKRNEGKEGEEKRTKRLDG